MPNDFEARVGHQFRFQTKPAPGFDGIVHCEVREMEEPRLLSFSWKGGPVDTIVRFSLEPSPNGTRLYFEQAGFDGLKAIMVSFLLGGGWKKMFRRSLPRVIENIDNLDQLEDKMKSSGTEAVS